MRPICTTIAIMAACLLLSSQLVQASDLEAEIRQMQDQIAELQGQPENQPDSFFPTKDEVGSALSTMIEDTDFGGWVAGSYNYNFRGSSSVEIADGDNPPAVAATHPNSNSFQLDQAWIFLSNEATEDSRGGINLDYQWGVIGGGDGGQNCSTGCTFSWVSEARTERVCQPGTAFHSNDHGRQAKDEP